MDVRTVQGTICTGLNKSKDALAACIAESGHASSAARARAVAMAGPDIWFGPQPLTEACSGIRVSPFSEKYSPCGASGLWLLSTDGVPSRFLATSARLTRRSLRQV